MENLPWESRKLALIEEITRAFDGVAREDGVTLREAAVIDNYGSMEERAEARKEDTETRWQDVPHDDIACGDAILNFLDAKGFRYYLPAFLIWCLRNRFYPGSCNDELVESNTDDQVISSLSVGRDGTIPDYKREHFESLNAGQSKVVAHFLQFNIAADKAVLDEWQAESGDPYIVQTIDSPEYKKWKIEANVPDDYAQNALDLYWKQFL